MKRSLATGAAAAAAALILSLVPAMPASAAVLPAGDELFTVTAWADHIQVFSVDPSDGRSELLSDAVPENAPYQGDDQFFSGIDVYSTAWDPSTGTGYLVAAYRLYDGANGGTEWYETYFATVDLDTGIVEFFGGSTATGEDAHVLVTGLAIDDSGAAYAIGIDDPFSSDVELYHVDLATGVLTVVNAASDLPWLDMLVYSTQAGEFFAANDAGIVFLLDVATAEVVQVLTLALDQIDESGADLTSLQLDKRGDVWAVVQDDNDGESLLVRGLRAPGDLVLPDIVGEFHVWDGGYSDFQTYSLLITHKPTPNAGNGTMYAIAGGDLNFNAFQLFRVDPTTGLSTPVGTGAGAPDDESRALSPAYDPITKSTYYIADPDSAPDYLARLNLTTGASSKVADFWEDSDELDYVQVDALAIGTDGSAFVLGTAQVGDGSIYAVLSLDLATAELTLVDELTFGQASPAEPPMFAFAASPVTGRFYAVSRDVPALLEVNVENGTTTDLGVLDIRSFDPGDSYVLGMQIDGNGRFWVISDADSDPDGEGPIAHQYWVHLSSFTLDDLDTLDGGMLWDDPYYTSALLFVPTLAAAPGPQLAATGADVAPWAIGAAVLLVAGGVILFSVRRRRTTD